MMGITLLNSDIEKIAVSLFNPENMPRISVAAAPAHVNAQFSCAAAMQLAKIAKQSPQSIAQKLADKISALPYIEKTEISGPGFINITVNDGFLTSCAAEAIADPEEFTKTHTPAEKIVLEFVSANPTGPLHVASGRGASLGDSLVRIHRALGYDIKSEYYVNNAGNQVNLLGQSIAAHKKGMPVPQEGYHGSYVADLAGLAPDNLTDEEYAAFGIKTLLEGQKQDMKDFAVEFDRWFLESELHTNGDIKKTLSYLKEHGEVTEKEGALWLGKDDADNNTEDKARVLVRADGRPTYFLADIAYHKNKYDRGFTQLIDIWGADHHGYVPRMNYAIKMLGKQPESFKVILHQLVHLVKDGEAVKMSKRAGEFITLKELVDEVGTNACRFLFAARTPNSQMTFDINLAKKQTQENPVFYVQYVHARICSIFEKAAEMGINFNGGCPHDYVLCRQEKALLSKLLWFPHVLQTCADDLSPHYVTNYLLELAGLFHPFYDSCKVLDETNPETTNARLFICAATRIILARALEVIGVTPAKRM